MDSFLDTKISKNDRERILRAIDMMPSTFTSEEFYSRTDSWKIDRKIAQEFFNYYCESGIYQQTGNSYEIID